MAGHDEQVNPSRLFGLVRPVAPVGTGIISTILKVDAWASSIQSDTPAFVPTPLPGSTACDVIEQFAQAWASDATGSERLLLLKSLQEAILCCVGRDTDLMADEIIGRLNEFVDLHGKSVFMQLFLSLFFFNGLLSDRSQPSWSTTLSLEELEHNIENLEGMCRKAVIAAYADVRDRSTAKRLVDNIQAELQELLQLAA